MEADAREGELHSLDKSQPLTPKFQASGAYVCKFLNTDPRKRQVPQSKQPQVRSVVGTIFAWQQFNS
jgi:hypothetical protein